jgi:hypothetical protein
MDLEILCEVSNFSNECRVSIFKFEEQPEDGDSTFLRTPDNFLLLHTVPQDKTTLDMLTVVRTSTLK